jgi:hypothetical protein
MWFSGIEVMTLDTALALLQRTHEAAAALLARDWMGEYMSKRLKTATKNSILQE